jgi:hypothetical protein
MSESTRSTLERLVDEVAGRSVVGTVSVAIQTLAEDIAREAMEEPGFREAIRALVRERSRALLADLLTRRNPEETS